jgi:muramidase (phage lysozyme)
MYSAQKKSVDKSAQLCAFLDMIAWSELGDALLQKSDDGYNVIVGSTSKNLNLFVNYDDHPRQFVFLKKLNITSSAAGRYQILARYFDYYKKLLRLNDFSPAAQDAIAIQLIRERRALADIEAGNLDLAIIKCRKTWASLPGAGYGQHEQAMNDLAAVFVRAGGLVG